MFRSALIGLLVGLASGLWMWMEYALGLHTTHVDIGRYTGFVSMIFPILGMYGALRSARSVGAGLGLAATLRQVIALSAAAAPVMALMAWGYVAWLHPAWLSVSAMTVAEFVLQSALATAIGGLVLGAIVRACMGSTDRKRILQ